MSSLAQPFAVAVAVALAVPIAAPVSALPLPQLQTLVGTPPAADAPGPVIRVRVPGGHSPGGHGPGGHSPGGHSPGGHTPGGHTPGGHAPAVARGHGVLERALTMRPQPAVVADEATNACKRRFKSYDVASRTYLGFDRKRHACP